MLHMQCDINESGVMAPQFTGVMAPQFSGVKAPQIIYLA